VGVGGPRQPDGSGSVTTWGRKSRFGGWKINRTRPVKQWDEGARVCWYAWGWHRGVRVTFPDNTIFGLEVLTKTDGGEKWNRWKTHQKEVQGGCISRGGTWETRAGEQTKRNAARGWWLSRQRERSRRVFFRADELVGAVDAAWNAQEPASLRYIIYRVSNLRGWASLGD